MDELLRSESRADLAIDAGLLDRYLAMYANEDTLDARGRSCGVPSTRVYARGYAAAVIRTPAFVAEFGAPGWRRRWRRRYWRPSSPSCAGCSYHVRSDVARCSTWRLSPALILLRSELAADEGLGGSSRRQTAAWVAGCGASDAARERTGSAASEIQAGATDSTHTFAVGVVQVNASTIEFCSGALLAPNLVATARHCVAQISSAQIDCAKSTFGALVSTSSLYVTTDTVITQRSNFIPVAANGIKVPAPANVCGNDIALLILSQSISLPGGYPAGYVVPAILPPLTDPSRSTTITAIGYGIDTPTDDASAMWPAPGESGENVGPDVHPRRPVASLDCFEDPTRRPRST